jgi:formate/nitrite transporter FocA (FNT family)
MRSTYPSLQIQPSNFLLIFSLFQLTPGFSTLTAIVDAFTPAQTTEPVSRIGAKKARMRIDKMFLNSFMGGPLLGFGCALLLSTNASPWFQTNAPGLIRTIGATFFPVGLIMVILTGADLFTSYVLVSFTPPLSLIPSTDSNQFLTVALLHRRISVLDLLKTWVVSFFGNLAGMLFFMAVLTGCTSLPLPPPLFISN